MAAKIFDRCGGFGQRCKLTKRDRGRITRRWGNQHFRRIYFDDNSMLDLAGTTSPYWNDPPPGAMMAWQTSHRVPWPKRSG